MQDRLPPQDIQTEQSILSSCLLDSESLTIALDILQPEDFYKTSHQKIFKTIQHLVSHKKPVDLTTVAACLLESKEINEVGGASYLSTLLTECPIAVNIETYAETVKSKAILRTLIKIQTQNISKCYEATTENTPDLLDNIQKSVLSVEVGGHKNNFISMSELTGKSYIRYENLQAGKGSKAIKTGLPSVDQITGGGFRGSKLILIAARPRIGKTSMMTSMSKNMAVRGHKVGIFSIEMDASELDDRFTSAETGINSLKLSSGKGLGAEDWTAINEAAEEKVRWNILISDEGGLNILKLKREARKMKKAGVEIIFIDQLSKIKSGIKGSLYEQNTYIVNELATLKKELRMPIVLLAQISRRLDRSKNKPTLGSLKSTGSLEEDADIILFIHRSYEYSKNEEEKYKGVLEVAKQRSGPCRSIELNWVPKTTTFTEMHHDV